MITIEKLIACGLQPTQARLFAPFIDPVFERFAISKVEHQAAFIGEARHESMNFTRLEESTRYSSVERMKFIFRRLRPLPDDLLAEYVNKSEKFANLVYANQNGNGDEASGDGWLFRGRGLPQLTGRANYEMAAMDCAQPYVANPDLVREPEHAALVFGSFWRHKQLAAAFDAGGIDLVSRRIVGDNRTNAERKALYEECLHALS